MEHSFRKIVVLGVMLACVFASSAELPYKGGVTIGGLKYNWYYSPSSTEEPYAELIHDDYRDIIGMTVPDSISFSYGGQSFTIPVKLIDGYSLFGSYLKKSSNDPRTCYPLRALTVGTGQVKQEISSMFSRYLSLRACNDLLYLHLGKNYSDDIGFPSNGELRTIIVDKDNPRYSDRGCNGLFAGDTLVKGGRKTRIPEDIRVIRKLFTGKTQTGTHIIPNTVEVLGPSALLNNQLKAFVIPSSLKTIDYLGGSYGSLTICSNNVSGARLQATSIKDLFIAKEVTDLNDSEIIYYPRNNGLTIKENVYCYNPEPPAANEKTFTSMDDENGAYDYLYNTATLHVPSGSLTAYFLHPVWGKFTHIEEDAVEPQSLEWDGTESLTLEVGESIKFNASVMPENANATPLWSTNDEKVATVSSSGTITAVAPGETDIVVTAHKFQWVCHVTVNGSVTFDKNIIVAEPGENIRLYITQTPVDKPMSKVCFSLNSWVADIDAGIVKAKNMGETFLFVQCGDALDSCRVIVVEAPIVVQFDQSNITTKTNKIVTLTPSYTPNDVIYQYVFENSDPDVVFYRVNQDNIQLVGLKPGKATLTATLAGVPEGVTVIPATCEITVLGDFKQGDVNGDGIVNGADVTALYNVLLIDTTANGDADVNGDGIVNGSDVTALYNLLLN